MTTSIIPLVLLVLVALWAMGIYNALVKLRNMMQEGWSGIDVQLKRRHNLIPNLLETVKAYAAHEKDVLEGVVRERSRSMSAGNAGEVAMAENMLTNALGRLFALSENYPDLKADANFREFQKELSELEDQIQLARRYYNGTVRELNVKVESFPSNLIAKAFGFGRGEFFELEDPGEREVPSVKF